MLEQCRDAATMVQLATWTSVHLFAILNCYLLLGPSEGTCVHCLTVYVALQEMMGWTLNCLSSNLTQNCSDYLTKCDYVIHL